MFITLKSNEIKKKKAALRDQPGGIYLKNPNFFTHRHCHFPNLQKSWIEGGLKPFVDKWTKKEKMIIHYCAFIFHFKMKICFLDDCLTYDILHSLKTMQNGVLSISPCVLLFLSFCLCLSSSLCLPLPLFLYACLSISLSLSISFSFSLSFSLFFLFFFGR